jgi:hypothetical protein
MGNYTTADPKEVKKQRDREWYAKIKMIFPSPGDSHGSLKNSQQKYRAPAGGHVF